jgi:nitrate reductase NapE component
VEKAIINYNFGVGQQEDYVIRAGTLVAYNGAGTEIVIPDSVKAIADECFENSQITSVILPSGLKSIGKESFRRCRSLTNINLPEGLVSIGDYAFADCSNLINVYIPNSVTSLGVGAFSCLRSTADEAFAHLERSKKKKENKDFGIAALVIFGIIVYVILSGMGFFR